MKKAKQWASTVNLDDWESVTVKDRRKLPNIAALYVVLDDLDRVLYVGESLQLAFRLASNHKAVLDPRAQRVKWYPLLPDLLDQRHYMEELLTDRLRPLLNLEPSTYKCFRCSHRWVSRVGALPVKCPKCSSTEWMNKPEARILDCFKCSYFWTPKTKGIPKECPSCHSRKWNQPRGK